MDHYAIYSNFFMELFTLIAAALGAWKSAMAKAETAKNREAIEKVDAHVNGRMEDLLEVTRKKSLAEGILFEQETPAVRRTHISETPPDKE